MKIDILELIPTGKNKRITNAEICKKTGLYPSQVRFLIHKARTEFAPICADDKGFFIAETPEDINNTIATFNSKIHKMIKAREGLRKAQQKLSEEI